MVMGINPLAASMPPIGNLLTQPQMPAPGVAPTDPSQIGLWQKFQQRLQQDPNLRMALLTTGLNLLKSPQVGQSGFDVFSNAALTGVGTLDQLRQRDLQNQRVDRAEGREDTRVGLETRRTAATEAGVTETQKRTAQDQTQFDTQIQLYRDKLAEDARQFNERKAAGALGGSSDITGQERILNQMVDALVTTGAFPNTAEGRAKALLAVNPIVEGSITPRDKFKYSSELAAQMAVFNPELGPQEIARRSTELSNLLFDSLQPAAPGSTTPDSLEGRTINHSSQGVGKVVATGNGMYIVEFPGGNTAPITKEAVERLLATQVPNGG